MFRRSKDFERDGEREKYPNQEAPHPSKEIRTISNNYGRITFTYDIENPHCTDKKSFTRLYAVDNFQGEKKDAIGGQEEKITCYI